MADNLYTVFAPTGERFEVSKPNFNDLITHLGWTTSPVAIAAATTPEAPAATPPAAPIVEPEVKAEEAHGNVSENGNGDLGVGSEGSIGGNAGEVPAVAQGSDVPSESGEGAVSTETPAVETPKVRAHADDFDDLADKADVAAYIAATYPEAKIDGRANRDNLIAQAIELATPIA